jgi:DNA-binding response OmpR family regulator
MKILVADDEMTLRNIYKQMLEEEGYQVDLAEDGERALVLLQEGGYDLVLLDVQMPKMNGMETVEALKRIHSSKPNGPIFFLTNNSDEVTIAKGVDLEIQGYLIKSQYTPDKLVREVNRILNGENPSTKQAI